MENKTEKGPCGNGTLFSIGEIAKALGITRRIILNYEACGLIQPDQRTGTAGNRYYTIDTLTQIRSIRVFQSFGLTLEEIRGYFDGTMELSTLIQRLEAMRDELNRNIQILYEREKSPRNSIELIETAPQTIYCRKYLSSSIAERITLLRNTALEAIHRYGTEANSRWYSIAHNFLHPDWGHSFCVAVPPESTGAYIEILPVQKALSCIHHGAYEEIPAVMETMLAHAKEHGLRTQGNVRCIYLEGPPQRQDKSKFVTQVLLLLDD